MKFKNSLFKMNSIQSNVYSSLIAFTFFFGIFGNFICFLVYSRKKLEKISSSFFFKSMAVSDIFILFQLIRHFLREVFNYNLKFLTDASCKITNYVLFSNISVSAWIMVYIIFDRFISIKYFQKFNFRNDLKIKRFILFSIFLISFIFYVPFGIYFKFKEENNAKNQTGIEAYCSNFKNYNIFYILDLFYSSVIPFLLMICFSIVLSIFIFKSRNRFNNPISKKDKKTLKKDVQFSVTTIVLCVIFLATNFPSAMIDFFEFYPFIYYMIDYLLFVNCSWQFVIHLITNKIFRKEIIRIILEITRTNQTIRIIK